METILETTSRHGEKRYLKKIDENLYHYWAISELGLVWVNFSDESTNVIKSIDFDGGPALEINNPQSLDVFGLENIIIKSIRSITQENDICIKFELITKEI